MKSRLPRALLGYAVFALLAVLILLAALAAKSWLAAKRDEQA